MNWILSVIAWIIFLDVILNFIVWSDESSKRLWILTPPQTHKIFQIGRLIRAFLGIILMDMAL
jgi:hypothetical protein